MKMFVGAQWVDKPEQITLRNPWDGSPIDTVPAASLEDVETALSTAVKGAAAMARLTAHERYSILLRAAQLISSRKDDFARTLTLEAGKTVAEARGEVGRAVQTLTVSGEEAKRIHGETVPLDADPSGGGRFGFTIRVPCGVVLAISPFNFPLNLVCHKVGPALAAGNAVVIKPAGVTPLSALKLTEVLLEAGVPPEGIQCITGPGGTIGDALCSDSRVRKITFTGSLEVGEHICRVGGLKKVTMELGSNSPLIIMPDANLEKVAAATVATGYSYAGQVCISTQRVLAQSSVYGDFLDVLKQQVEGIPAGNPSDERIKMGPMIREADAIRVESWIREALSTGARLVVGGQRSGTLHAPTVVADVKPDMRIYREELFGPAVAVSRFRDVDEAIAMANDSRYGLSAGIFTENINTALRFAREVQSGNIMINWGPQWRADLMPYGGIKGSGMGKEGPRYAVEEMTELKLVVFHQ